MLLLHSESFHRSVDGDKLSGRTGGGLPAYQPPVQSASRGNEGFRISSISAVIFFYMFAYLTSVVSPVMFGHSCCDLLPGEEHHS